MHANPLSSVVPTAPYPGIPARARILFTYLIASLRWSQALNVSAYPKYMSAKRSKVAQCLLAPLRPSFEAILRIP